MRGLVPNWGGGEGSPWQITGSAPSPVLLATTSFLSGYGICGGFSDLLCQDPSPRPGEEVNLATAGKDTMSQW